MVAPGAQAALDEGNTVRSGNDQSGVVLKGDDKTFAAVPDGGIMVRGDDKTFAADPQGGIMVRGDDKVLEPANGILVRGEHYVSQPTSGPGWNQHGYAVAKPTDMVGNVLVRGEHYVSQPTSGPGWNQHGYAVAKPTDIGQAPGRQPVQVTSEPSGFDLRDGLFAAIAALGLALLAFGAMLISRRSGRPETA
jgi:hypothetical protein